MNALSSRFWRRGAVALFSLTLLLSLSSQVVAGPGDATFPSLRPHMHSAPQNQTFSTAPMAAGNWLSEMMNKLESWLNNRTHMIQFCAIAMVIGLLIIWWRKT